MKRGVAERLEAGEAQGSWGVLVLAGLQILLVVGVVLAIALTL